LQYIDYGLVSAAHENPRWEANPAAACLFLSRRVLMNSRWPFYASVVVLVCECIACFLAGAIEWGDRGVMVSADSAEAAEQARFAVELGAIGTLNLLASIPFLLRHSGWAWLLVLGMQLGIFVVALIEGVLTDLGWFYFSGLPLLTLFLLVAFREAQARLKLPVERNLTAL